MGEAKNAARLEITNELLGYLPVDFQIEFKRALRNQVVSGRYASLFSVQRVRGNSYAKAEAPLLLHEGARGATVLL